MNVDCLSVIADHCDVQTALNLAATSKTNWDAFGFNANRYRSGFDEIIDHLDYHFITIRRYYLDCLWYDEHYPKNYPCDFDDYYFNYPNKDVPVYISIKEWCLGNRPCGPGGIQYDPEGRSLAP